MKHLKAKISVKKEGKKITVIASDETLDRHGEVIPADSWDLSKFKGSPRMLVDHDHRVEKIVGKWTNVRVEGRQLMMDAEFHGITELSRAVEEMVAEGFLDTVSVGFIPKEPTEVNPKHINELIETSWVTVPANPNARLVKALELPVSDDEKNKLAEFTKDIGEGEDAHDDEADEDDIEDADEELPEFDVMDDEAEKKLEKMGVKVFKNVAELKAAIEGRNDVCVCISTPLAKTLLEDSEKLSKALTEVEALKQLRNAKFLREVVKETVRNLNHSLHQFNKMN